MHIQTLLSNTGINPGMIHHNLPVPELIETAVKYREAVLADSGAIVTYSGKYTGRSPGDKFVVDNPESTDSIWWGKVNKKISPANFDTIHQKINEYLAGKELFVTDCYCGADKNYRLNARFLTLKAWHAHFINNMFIMPSSEELASFAPDFTVINATGYFEKDWQQLGLNSNVFILVNIEQKLILIGGTEYSGEMKKGIFGIMNYLLPPKGVMPMHCSANKGEKGDTALFFGLSGTGKTTLSADPSRFLIGDDEHGWSDKNVFNFEGGCYAKCINLNADKEPEIWDAIKFGSILENVVYDKPTHRIKFDDGSITENTRVSYPIEFIKNYVPSGTGGVPDKIIFLTCDAFGVIPPVSKLSPDDAAYHFLSGYTAKVAGTERGITEPVATFSTCFGSPFMMHYPDVYGKLLATKMNRHNTPAYLVNTGWIEGAYGEGRRIDLHITRKIIALINDGTAERATTKRDDDLKLSYITELPNIPASVLDPSKNWKNTEAYTKARQKLIDMFSKNYTSISRPPAKT